MIGQSLNGAPILALRVTRDAREASNPDGSQPAVLYNANQHAREWITPEMIRRLAHLYIDNYGETGPAIGTDGNPVAGVTAEELTQLVNTRELWFIVSANPDGYDFTFTPATASGARTCATTTATARSRSATASTRTETTRPTGTTTTRAPRPIRRATPTAA